MQQKGDRGLFSLFVDRPIFTLMVTLALLLVGAISFAKLPLRFVPEGLSQNEIRIWIPLGQDMSPREVEEKVAKPLEEQLRTIPGIQRIRSDSGNGRAFVSAQLDTGMNPDLATAEVRDRIQRARLEWPPGTDRYFTWKEDASSVPLAFFQMLTPERSSDWDYLLDQVLRPRLEAVDGVGRVDIFGLFDETVRIWFNIDKLTAHRVDYRRLIERLSSDNFTEPLGEIDDGQKQFLVRLDSKFRALGEIETFPVRPGLALSDIARIERVPSVRDRLSRFNQKYTYSGMVRAAAGTNPVEASQRLHAALDILKEDPRLATLETRFLFDQGLLITESLDTLLGTSIQGGLLALIALLLFLRNLRFTIAIAVAIPLTLLIDGAFLYFTTSSLNVMTMAGMTLAVGMVVDNSVVVLENIRRLREQGMPIRQACIQGAREVGLAVTMATMTTVVVIVPMVFIGDKATRTTLGAVGLPLSVALLGSLFVALMLMPSGLTMSRVRGAPQAAFSPSPARRWSPVYWLVSFNQALLRHALPHRSLAIAGMASILSLSYFAFAAIEFDGGAGGIFQRGDISVNMSMPRGLDLQNVEEEVKSYEEFVLSHEEEWRVAGVTSTFSRNHANVGLVMKDDTSESETKRIRGLVEKSWPRRPGVEVTLGDRDDRFGGSSEEKNERNFVIRLYGRDSEFLMGLARKVRSELADLEEVEQIEIPQMDRNEEVVISLDKGRMQEWGVRPEVLFGTVSSGLQGRMLTRFEESDGRETQLITQFDRGKKNPSMSDLKNTRVSSDSGAFLKLEELSQIRTSKSLGSIWRVDGKSSVTIVGRRQAGIGPVQMNREVAKLMRRFPMPLGYSWSDESSFKETEMQMGELLQSLGLGIALVFLLMGVLFESVILSFSVLFTIPFALTGAVWAVYLLIGTLDPMVVIGSILLCGIVVNNGIVLLDCIHRLRREEGLGRADAILEGTRRRMRPIIMTAVTTIVGLLPMALFGDSSGQGPSYVGMSIAVVGGLTVSTIFTAFVVPLMYTVMDDLSAWFQRVWEMALSGRARRHTV